MKRRELFIATINAVVAWNLAPSILLNNPFVNAYINEQSEVAPSLDSIRTGKSLRVVEDSSGYIFCRITEPIEEVSNSALRLAIEEGLRNLNKKYEGYTPDFTCFNRDFSNSDTDNCLVSIKCGGEHPQENFE